MRFGIKAVPFAASFRRGGFVAGAPPSQPASGAFAYDEAPGKTAPAGTSRARSRPMKPL